MVSLFRRGPLSVLWDQGYDVTCRVHLLCGEASLQLPAPHVFVSVSQHLLPPGRHAHVHSPM